MCGWNPSAYHTLASTMERPDPLKVFMGSLNRHVIKPQLQDMFDRLSMTPVEIIVPACRDDKLAVAFACFGTSEEALMAVGQLNGLIDDVSPSSTGIYVHIGLDNGGFFLYQL